MKLNDHNWNVHILIFLCVKSIAFLISEIEKEIINSFYDNKFCIRESHTHTLVRAHTRTHAHAHAHINTHTKMKKIINAKSNEAITYLTILFSFQIVDNFLVSVSKKEKKWNFVKKKKKWEDICINNHVNYAVFKWDTKKKTINHEQNVLRSNNWCEISLVEKFL